MPGETSATPTPTFPEDDDYRVTLTCARLSARGRRLVFRSLHESWADAEAAETLTLSSLPAVYTTLTDTYGSYSESTNHAAAAHPLPAPPVPGGRPR